MKTSELIKVLSDALESQGDIEVFMTIQIDTKFYLDPVEQIVCIGDKLMLITNDMAEQLKETLTS